MFGSESFSESLSFWMVLLAVAVDHHAVSAAGDRCDQRFDRGDDTDAHDDQIGGNDLAVRQPHARHPIRALDRRDRNAEPQVDAMLAVLLLIEARQILARDAREHAVRSEEHTSELQSLMRISYAVFCLQKT